jgi:long-chain acyl-CoA synthetase
VDERYGRIIDAIYAGQGQVHVSTEVTFEDGRKGRIEADLVIRDTGAHAAPRREAA